MSSSRPAVPELSESSSSRRPPGWTFTTSLWGQDGFGIDEACPITPTPQDFTFGVCASGATDPRCGLDPADAPFTMDTIPPPGVEQEVILDATLRPVQLRGGEHRLSLWTAAADSAAVRQAWPGAREEAAWES